MGFRLWGLGFRVFGLGVALKALAQYYSPKPCSKYYNGAYIKSSSPLLASPGMPVAIAPMARRTELPKLKP